MDATGLLRVIDLGLLGAGAIAPDAGAYWTGILVLIAIGLAYLVACRLCVAFCCRGWRPIRLSPRQRCWCFRLPDYLHRPSWRLPRRFRRWHLATIRARLFGLGSREIEDLFRNVHQSRWFRWKLRFGMFLLANRVPMFLLFFFVPMSRRLRAWLSISPPDVAARRLDGLLKRAEFYRLRGFPPVWGYASWLNTGRNTAIVGLEGWVPWLPFFGRSAAAHELMHCAQQICLHGFDLEWSQQGLTRTEMLYLELHANISGSPLWFLLELVFLALLISLIMPIAASLLV